MLVLVLLGAFLGVAGLYIFLSADFLAVAQVLIYVGGVLVLIAFGLLIVVLVPSLGHTVNGATRWLKLGPITLQASEPARLRHSPCTSCSVSARRSR